MTNSRVVAVTALITVAVAVLLFATWVYSGLYNPAAAAGAGGIVDGTLKALTDHSVEARARALPPSLVLDSADLRDGAERFQKLCVGCHGAPGVPRDVTSEGLTPQAPDLSLGDRTEAEIYWVVRNGIRNRGMPSYYRSHTENQMWAIARFAKQTAGMSAAEYEGLFLSITQPADPARTPAHIH